MTMTAQPKTETTYSFTKAMNNKGQSIYTNVKIIINSLDSTLYHDVIMNGNEFNYERTSDYYYDKTDEGNTFWFFEAVEIYSDERIIIQCFNNSYYGMMIIFPESKEYLHFYND